MDGLRGANSEYSFWILDPAVEKYKGHHWWKRHLRQLISICDGDEEGLRKVAQSVLCIEFFPYHSRSSGKFPEVESQKFAFHLVREAMDRNAVIVVMRSEKHWCHHVPELEQYRGHGRCFVLRNVQNPTISEGNLPQWGWRSIIDALGAAVKNQ